MFDGMPLVAADELRGLPFCVSMAVAISVSAILARRGVSTWSQVVDRMTVILSVAFWIAALWFALWDNRAMTIAVFGKEPFGCPWYVVVPIIITALCLPLPSVMWTLVAETAIRKGIVRKDVIEMELERHRRRAIFAVLFYLFMITACCIDSAL